MPYSFLPKQVFLVWLGVSIFCLFWNGVQNGNWVWGEMKVILNQLYESNKSISKKYTVQERTYWDTQRREKRKYRLVIYNYTKFSQNTKEQLQQIKILLSFYLQTDNCSPVMQIGRWRPWSTEQVLKLGVPYWKWSAAACWAYYYKFQVTLRGNREHCCKF